MVRTAGSLSPASSLGFCAQLPSLDFAQNPKEDVVQSRGLGYLLRQGGAGEGRGVGGLEAVQYDSGRGGTVGSD
eukprot:COSAG04_NODE_18818_length_432_cov_0.540541_1_plen_73_part_10